MAQSQGRFDLSAEIKRIKDQIDASDASLLFDNLVDIMSKYSYGTSVDILDLYTAAYSGEIYVKRLNDGAIPKAPNNLSYVLNGAKSALLELIKKLDRHQRDLVAKSIDQITAPNVKNIPQQMSPTKSASRESLRPNRIPAVPTGILKEFISTLAVKSSDPIPIAVANKFIRNLLSGRKTNFYEILKSYCPINSNDYLEVEAESKKQTVKLIEDAVPAIMAEFISIVRMNNKKEQYAALSRNCLRLGKLNKSYKTFMKQLEPGTFSDLNKILTLHGLDKTLKAELVRVFADSMEEYLSSNDPELSRSHLWHLYEAAGPLVLGMRPVIAAAYVTFSFRNNVEMDFSVRDNLLIQIDDTSIDSIPREIAAKHLPDARGIGKIMTGDMTWQDVINATRELKASKVLRFTDSKAHTSIRQR